MVHRKSIRHSLIAALLGSVTGTVAAAPPDAATLFAKHCASCHGAERLGAMGPALLPASLRRTPKTTAAGVIAAGRHATQIPAFQQTLKPEETAALVDYICIAPASQPVW